jgi:hypothetical protein
MARRNWLIAALIAAVVAFVLGMVGLARMPAGPHGAFDIAYNSLQLFVLGSDPLGNGGPYNAPLEIARFLAPATTAFALVEALRAVWRDEWRRRRLARRNGHAIVCGDDVASRVLARNLSAAGMTVVRIAAGIGDATAGRDGIAVVRGDAREQATLRAAGIAGASRVYACASGSGENAAVALAAAQLRTGGSGPRLEVFVQVADDDLVEALRVRQVAAPRTPGASIDFFAVEDTAARALLAQPQLATARSLAVLGSGAFAAALVRAVIRTPLADTARSVVVHTDEPSAVDELAARFAAAERGAVVATAGRFDPVEPSADLVIVCLADDEVTVGTCLRLLRSPGRPVIACLRRGAPFAEALAGTQGLTVFGVLDAACTGEAIEGDALLGRAARAIHHNYLENCRAAGDTPQTNDSMREWPELPAYKQESNYAQAEHIGFKLHALGAILTTTPPPEPFEFRDGEVLALARLEHQRWMDERRAAGFVWGPRRERNEHPDLVDWPDLSAESRRKDEEAVEQLPGLLGSTGLHIVRLPRRP